MSHHDLVAELATLDIMNRAALAERWEKVFSRPAPSACRSPLLRRALAWQVQVASSKLSWQRALRLPSTGAGLTKLAPGTRLIREWQGRTYQVTVQANGFDYAGKAYRSLSAIARVITGTPWSGPSFFGLR